MRLLALGAIASACGATDPPPARRDLAAGVPASGRPRSDGSARPDPGRRPGRAEAERAPVRAGAAADAAGERGQARAAAAAGAVDGLRAGRRDARHAGAARSLHDLLPARPNAMAIGTGRPIIVVSSQFIEMLDPGRGMGRLRTRARARARGSRPLHDDARDPPPAPGRAPRPDPAPVPRRHGRAARVVTLGRADRRPGGRARLPRPGRVLPDAHGDGRGRAVEPPRPRRLPRPGLRVRGVGLALGPDSARPRRAARDAPLRRSARPAAHGVGAQRRLRPHPRRPVSAPRRIRPSRPTPTRRRSTT